MMGGLKIEDRKMEDWKMQYHIWGEVRRWKRWKTKDLEMNDRKMQN